MLLLGGGNGCPEAYPPPWERWSPAHCMPALDLMPSGGCGARPGVSGFKDQSHYAARRRQRCSLQPWTVSTRCGRLRAIRSLPSNPHTQWHVVSVPGLLWETHADSRAGRRRTSDGRATADQRGSKPFLYEMSHILAQRASDTVVSPWAATTARRARALCTPALLSGVAPARVRGPKRTRGYRVI